MKEHKARVLHPLSAVMRRFRSCTSSVTSRRLYAKVLYALSHVHMESHMPFGSQNSPFTVGSFNIEGSCQRVCTEGSETPKTRVSMVPRW